MKTEKVITWILIIFIMFPIILLFSQSFMGEIELEGIYDLNTNYNERVTVKDLIPIPRKFTLSQYAKLICDSPNYFHLYKNSFEIVIPTVIINLLVSILAAVGIYYKKSGINYKLIFFYAVLLLLPFEIISVPQFIAFMNLSLIDSKLSLILSNAFSPIGIFIILIFLKRVPYSTIEAAKIDGANNIKILSSIVLPQIKQGILLSSIFVFIDSWNMIEQATIFMTTQSKMPLSVLLGDIIKSNPELTSAASIIYIVPVLFLFIGMIGYLGIDYLEDETCEKE